MMKNFLFFLCSVLFVNNAYAANWPCTEKNRSILGHNRDQIHHYFVNSSPIENTLQWSHRTPLHTLSKKGQASLGANYKKDGAEGLLRLQEEILRMESLTKTAKKASRKLYLVQKHTKKNIKNWNNFKANCSRKGADDKLMIGAGQTEINLEFYRTKAKLVKKISNDFSRDLKIYKKYDKGIK